MKPEVDLVHDLEKLISYFLSRCLNKLKGHRSSAQTLPDKLPAPNTQLQVLPVYKSTGDCVLAD